MPDHEVRLLMSRGKVARGIILARVASVQLGIARENRALAEAEANRARAEKEGPVELELEKRTSDRSPKWHDTKLVLDALAAQMLPDVVSFDFVFRNDGELTIRAPAMEFRIKRNERLYEEGMLRPLKAVPPRLKLEDAIVYPGDEEAISEARLSLECKRETVLAVGDYTVSWKVFLDNSPPSFGEIDLASLMEAARRGPVNISR